MAGVRTPPPPLSSTPNPMNRSDQSMQALGGVSSEALAALNTFATNLQTIFTQELPTQIQNIVSLLGGVQRESDAAFQSLDKHANKTLGDLQRMTDQFQSSNMGSWKKFRQSMQNLILMHGRDTEKAMRNMNDTERRLYQQHIQQLVNDTSKKTDALTKQVFNVFFKTNYEDAKRMFQMQFGNWYDFMDKKWRFMQTTAWKMTEKMVQGTLNMAGKVFTWIWDGLQKIANFLKFDMFSLIQEQVAKLTKMLKSIPGAEAALASFKQIREVMFDLSRRFGVNGPDQVRLTEGVLRLSNSFVTATQYAEAMRAAMDAGVRGGTENITNMSQGAADIAQAYGLTVTSVAQGLTNLRRVFGVTQEEAEAFYARLDIFAASTGGMYGTSVAEMNDLFQSSLNDFYRLGITLNTPEAFNNLQQSLMVTAQLAQSAGVNVSNMWSEMLAATTSQGSAIFNLIGGFPEVLQYLRAGDVAGLWDDVLSRVADYRDLIDAVGRGGGEGQAAFESLQNVFGTRIPLEDWIRLSRILPDIDQYAAAASASMVSVDEALAHTQEGVVSGVPPAQLLANDMLAFANSVSIGGTALPVVLESLELLDTRLSALSQGFGIIGQGMEFALGPLAGVISPVVSLATALLAIGGIMTDFSPEEMESFGVLGDLFSFGKDTVDQYGSQVLGWLKSMWDGVLAFFDGSQGRSPFQRLLLAGVTWLQENGPWLAEQAVLVVQSIADALEYAFYQFENSPAAQAIGDAFGVALSAVARIVNITVDTFAPILVGMLEMLAQAFDRPEVMTGVNHLLDSLGTALGGAAYVFEGFISDVLPILVDAMQGLFASLRLQLPDSAITDMFLGNKDDAVQTLVSLGMPELIPESEQARLDTINRNWRAQEEQIMADQGRGHFENFLGFSSPTRDALFNRFVPDTSTSVTTTPSTPASVFGDKQQAMLNWIGTGGPVFGANRGRDEEGRMRTHNGIDLEAPYGTEVLALDAGTVDTVVWLGDPNFQGDPAQGNSVLLHGSRPGPGGEDLYYAYWHLSTVNAEPGMSVSAGDVLGKVGYSGNASESDPHLHLGVEDGRGGNWLDPTEYVPALSAFRGVVRSDSELAASSGQAEGGLIMSDLLTLVGEAGPEVIIPLPEMADIAKMQSDAKEESIAAMQEDNRRLLEELIRVRESIEGLKDIDHSILLRRDY